MTAARPIRGLNAPLRSLSQACRELGLDLADYRAPCARCNGSGCIASNGEPWTDLDADSDAVRFRAVWPVDCPDCNGLRYQPERNAP